MNEDLLATGVVADATNHIVAEPGMATHAGRDLLTEAAIAKITLEGKAAQAKLAGTTGATLTPVEQLALNKYLALNEMFERDYSLILGFMISNFALYYNGLGGIPETGTKVTQA